MSKHTPGPWAVSDKFGSVGAIRSDVGFVAFPCQPRGINEEKEAGESWIDMQHRTQPEREAVNREQQANARLIAAAPDLLNACRAAFEALESLQGGCTDSDDGTVEAITVWCPEVIDELRAAIEKAVGY